jgi:acylphosphatase
MSNQRWRISFTGRVQGVGFRYRTQLIAKGLPITGWVANLPNGSVLVVVEGQDSDLREFLEGIQTAMYWFHSRYPGRETGSLREFSRL